MQAAFSVSRRQVDRDVVMMDAGRGLVPGLRTGIQRWAALVAVAAGLHMSSAEAGDVSIRGAQMDRFARIALEFDQPTKVQVKASGTVLVIGFGAATKVRAEKLAAELASLVSAVRRDPDEMGLRLALTAPFRANVLEAGERVFIDLLPPNWAGLPPGLPPEIVSELAERAHAAEAKLKEAARRKVDPKPVTVRLARLANLTRLVFEPRPGSAMRVKESPGALELAFDGAGSLDDADGKPKLAPGVKSYGSAVVGNALVVKLAAMPGYAIQSFREGDTLVVDLARPSPPVATPPPHAARPPASSTAGGAQDRPHATPPAAGAHAAEPAHPVASPPARSAEPDHEAAAPAVPGPDPRSARSTAPAGIVVPRLEAGPDGASILFPFAVRTAAAAFERGGRLNVVFDTRDRIETEALARPFTDAPPLDQASVEDGFVVLRFPTGASGPPRLVPEGNGWRLALGNGRDLPPDALKVARAVDEAGRGIVTVSLPGGAEAHWVKEPDGSRIAVVTAFGRAQAVPLARSFVEFRLPPTVHGVVVEAKSDDLTVAFGGGGVVIGREAGLSLSAGRGRESGEVSDGLTLVLPRDIWMRDTGPGTLQRYHDLVAATADAPRSARAESRYRLARFMVANELNNEAASVLALARQDDPVFARRRETNILSGIAAFRSERPREARGFLNAEGLADDAEAGLWRALLDLRDHQWDRALAGLRKARDIVDLYPEELAARVALGILRAVIEKGDAARAEKELVRIDKFPSGIVPRDEYDLARARVDEANARTNEALKGYATVAESGSPRLAAEATFRRLVLALRTGAMRPDAVAEQLETLAVAWRGDEIELGTVVELARLYAKLGRWHDMFDQARYASRYFPDQEQTRALYDETARQFENLLMSSGGDKLPAVDALALYFDFKELAPVGRRGDELVRGLADRLVELDLLDQAADLLQHQVDKRLTGAARATVAARLAAVRLMNAKPIEALSALHATRLAELPASVKHVRLMLEAKAQADLTRVDLALEILDGEEGTDVDRLRAGILWGVRRWREAGEASERLVGTLWQSPEPLADRVRSDVVRAAVAYGLADERIGLDRLRQKFSAKMTDSPDAKTFELLLLPGVVQTREFRALATGLSRADLLRDMLTEWRARPDAPLGDVGASSGPAEPAHVAPAGTAQAQAPKPNG